MTYPLQDPQIFIRINGISTSRSRVASNSHVLSSILVRFQKFELYVAMHDSISSRFHIGTPRYLGLVAQFQFVREEEGRKLLWGQGIQGVMSERSLSS